MTWDLGELSRVLDDGGLVVAWFLRSVLRMCLLQWFLRNVLRSVLFLLLLN